MATAITSEQYEEMWRAYCQEQSNAHVSRATGIAENTVRKYIVKGDPRRGFAPLLARWRDAQAKVAREAVNDLAASQRGTLEAAKHAKDIVLRQLRDLKRDKNGRFKDPMRALRTAHELEALIHGEPTTRVDVTGAVSADDPMAGLDDVEVMAFLEAALPSLRSYGFGRVEAESAESAAPTVH